MRSRRGPGSFPSVPWPRRSREASRRKSRARTRSWASSTTASKSTSAPYQSTASIATIADAYAAGEQDVAAQVAVDELARDADRAPGGEETRHLGHALEAARRLLYPRDAVGSRPAIGPAIEHRCWTLDGGQRTMEPLPHRQDVCPTRGVGAGQHRPCRPAIHDQFALARAQRRSDPEVVAGHGPEDLRLPSQRLDGHVQRLEHEVARAPRRPLAAGKPFRASADPEPGEDLSGRLGHQRSSARAGRSPRPGR
jgi:hypothetical protein